MMKTNLLHMLTLCLVPLWLTGCASFTPQPGPGTDPQGNYRPLTLPFVALGDTQEHLSTGYPMHDNDSAVDAYVEVAQRPPEQTLFGRRVMEWVLHSNSDMPFLHLGDVMDLSCRIEAHRMTRVFRHATQPGVILPGNHDGLMFGIYAFNLYDAALDSEAAKWNRACLRGAEVADTKHKSTREAFSKRDFIAQYISEHANSNPTKAGLNAPPEAGVHEVSWHDPNPDAYLSGIEAKLLDGIGYANSYLAQRVKLPRAPGANRDVIIIGMDTNQAGPLVSTWDTIMGRSPGSMGHIHPDQIKATEKWVDEAISKGDIVVFAGHHNWRSLGLPTRVQLRTLMNRLKHPLVYLSAHTHRGFWAEHRTLAHRPLLEMNVSSLSDWPVAYRRIRFDYDEAANRLRVRADLMPEGDVPTQSYTDLLNAWQKQTCLASGVVIDKIGREDLELVKRQRDSRGSLVEWLLQYFSPWCEACDETLYRHAQSYQDELLLALIEVSNDLGSESHQLHTLKLPAWCKEQDYTVCAKSLMAGKPESYQQNVELFRRKAALVSLLNDHLDELDAPHAKAYMTCRAVTAARIDYDMTPDDKKNNRDEEKRRLEQFFRIEASVGME
jgi:hypothetical protein